MRWGLIVAPPGAKPPRPLTVRAQSIPPRHYFPEHTHAWHQVVYAISGVLTVAMESQSLAISPEQAVWLPPGLRNRVGSSFGAEFRSLWIADEAGHGLPNGPTVFSVSLLLQALIIEAAGIEDEPDEDGCAGGGQRPETAWSGDVRGGPRYWTVTQTVTQLARCSA